MSVSTHPASWPTEATFKPLDDAFATAFTELEGTVGYLEKLVDEEGWPDPPPTFETIGVLYNALDGLRTDLDQCTDKADELEKLVDRVNAIRRDRPFRVKRLAIPGGGAITVEERPNDA
jgi:hypothetical protein